MVEWQEGHVAYKFKTEWWVADIVICLGQGADLHMARLIPLPPIVSCSSKSRLVLPIWYWLTWVVWIMLMLLDALSGTFFGWKMST